MKIFNSDRLRVYFDIADLEDARMLRFVMPLDDGKLMVCRLVGAETEALIKVFKELPE